MPPIPARPNLEIKKEQSINDVYEAFRLLTIYALSLESWAYGVRELVSDGSLEDSESGKLEK